MAKNILVIDDDSAILDIMQIALQYEGFQVCTSTKGHNFRELVNQHSIDLVIVDYLLSDINGGEVCRQIKTCPHLKHLPVIMFSAYPRMMHSGGSFMCDTFIAKPFDLYDILQEIVGLLNCTSSKIFRSRYINSSH